MINQLNRTFLPVLLSILFAASTSASSLQLARELAEEGDWEACLIECQRIDLTCPAQHAAVTTLREMAEAQRNPPPLPSSWWRKLGALPIRGLVAFYRSAVAPALGTRCVLRPSCSAYSLQAARERGWLGIPMTADRLIREPSVVNAKEHPVGRWEGRTYYADPVSDHIGGH